MSESRISALEAQVAKLSSQLEGVLERHDALRDRIEQVNNHHVQSRAEHQVRTQTLERDLTDRKQASADKRHLFEGEAKK